MRPILSVYGLAINRQGDRSCPHTANMGSTNDLALAFANNLQRLMNHHDLSQAALSRKSGVGQSTLSKLLNVNDPENMNPRSSTIQRLSEHFGFHGWQLLIPGLPDEVLFGHARMPSHAAGGDVRRAEVDPRLLAKSIGVAIDAFAAKHRVPSSETLGAAAAFIYARVSNGIRMRDAESAVKELLGKTSSGVPDFEVGG